MVFENSEIFSLSSNPNLSEKIAKYLGISLSKIEITKFADGEQYIKLGENCRNKTCIFNTID